jgi:NADH-quinone oxidoreductase subunit L
MHHVPTWVAVAPTVDVVLGFWWLGVSTSASPASRQARPPARPLRFLLNKWYFDELYDVLLRTADTLWLGRLLWKARLADRGFGPDGLRPCDVTATWYGCRPDISIYAFAMLIGWPR